MAPLALGKEQAIQEAKQSLTEIGNNLAPLADAEVVETEEAEESPVPEPAPSPNPLPPPPPPPPTSGDGSEPEPAREPLGGHGRF
jgi:hypothetical protein